MNRVALLLVAVLALLAAGCSGRFAPIGPAAATDPGFLGCQVGSQPDGMVRTEDPLSPGQPLAGLPIEAMTPAQVGEAALARGLRATWRYTYSTGEASGFSECWCEPPPDGAVESLAYGLASEVVIFVDSGQTLSAPREQPSRGWGC
jgi:hypothetical protein